MAKKCNECDFNYQKGKRGNTLREAVVSILAMGENEQTNLLEQLSLLSSIGCWIGALNSYMMSGTASEVLWRKH